MAVDFVGGGLWVDRQDLFSGEVAGSFVQLSFTSQSHTHSVATGWAVVGEWEVFCLIKFQLLWDNFEVFSTFGRSTSAVGVISVHGFYKY